MLRCPNFNIFNHLKIPRSVLTGPKRPKFEPASRDTFSVDAHHSVILEIKVRAVPPLQYSARARNLGAAACGCHIASPQSPGTAVELILHGAMLAGRQQVVCTLSRHQLWEIATAKPQTSPPMGQCRTSRRPDS